MGPVLMFLGASALALIGCRIMNGILRAPDLALQKKFSDLTKDANGAIAGKTYEQIVAACGAPCSVSPTGDGGKVCQWVAVGYHIALLFDADNVCTGVRSEAKV